MWKNRLSLPYLLLVCLLLLLLLFLQPWLWSILFLLQLPWLWLLVFLLLFDWLLQSCLRLLLRRLSVFPVVRSSRFHFLFLVGNSNLFNSLLVDHPRVLLRLLQRTTRCSAPWKATASAPSIARCCVSTI
jgi:hypothetical protein